MTKFVKYVIFCWFCLTAVNVTAQDTTTKKVTVEPDKALVDSIRHAKDSIRYMNYLDKLYCDSLADSVFRAIVFDKFDSIAHYFPSIEDFREEGDSNELELLRVKYQTVYYGLAKDHKRMQKKAKKEYKIRIKSLVKKKTTTDIRDTEDGRRFCIVTIECGYMRKEALISFHLIKLGDKWFIGEKLKIKPKPKED